MKNKSTPPIGIFLTRRLFNTLIWTLTQFIGTEKEIGAIALSQNSAKLKYKILKYARSYTKDNAECVSVYFFKSEAEVLIEILISFFSIGKKTIPDYYSSLTKRGTGIPPTAEQQ